MKQVLCAAALAAGAAGAFADDDLYGCKVLLCLAHPEGPTAEPECRPPIERLWRDLRKGRGFPRCKQAESEGSYVVMGADPYELCPAPLVPAPAGTYIVMGSPAPIDPKTGWYVGGQQFILGGEPVMSEPPADLGQAPGQRACIGTVVGSYTIGGADAGTYSVSVVDAVTWLAPKGARSFDIYIDNAAYKRVHW